MRIPYVSPLCKGIVNTLCGSMSPISSGHRGVPPPQRINIDLLFRHSLVNKAWNSLPNLHVPRDSRVLQVFFFHTVGTSLLWRVSSLSLK